MILTKFGTVQWDLYKSYYKDKVSSNNKFNPKINFHKVGIYEFSWSGKCEYYLHNFRKNKLFKYKADDVYYTNRWNFFNDSTLDINGFKYKILYFKKDAIALLWNNPNWVDTLILVPSSNHFEVSH